MSVHWREVMCLDMGSNRGEFYRMDCGLLPGIQLTINLVSSGATCPFPQQEVGAGQGA